MADLLKSFTFAWKGFVYCLTNERNMRVHFVFMVYMYSYLFVYDFFILSKVEISVIFIANTLVFMGELINTAIENTINLLSEKYDKYAQIAKDTAAGAVLVGAFFAVAIGIALLWQPEAFRALFEYYKEKPLMIVILALSLALSVIFVFWGFGKKSKRKN